MQFLKARFHSRDEFLKAYASERPQGGLTVHTTQSVPPGASVIVDLDCEGLPNHVFLRAFVESAWRPRKGLRGGAIVAFGDGERAKTEFVMGVLTGRIANPPRRKHPRIPVTLPVRYRLGDAPGLTDAELVEVSLGGGQLRCQPRPPVGGALVLQLLPPGATAPIEIAGRVSYHVDSDRVGVQFVFRGGGGVGRLRELIRRICAA